MGAWVRLVLTCRARHALTSLRGTAAAVVATCRAVVVALLTCCGAQCVGVELTSSAFVALAPTFERLVLPRLAQQAAFLPQLVLIGALRAIDAPHLARNVLVRTQAAPLARLVVASAVLDLPSWTRGALTI